MALSSQILDRLPPLKGRLSPDASLATITWFGVGGPCDLMFRPADAEDLALFLKHLPAEVPVTVIGVGSNLLVRDGGIKGVVIRLGRGFVDIKAEGEDVYAGAAALDANVAQVAADAGIGGIEFLSGVPGTIGGALMMNAGAYGGDMSKIVVSATAVDRQGNMHSVPLEKLGFTYRHSETPEGWIFTGAHLRGISGDPVEISAKLANIKLNRENAQPIRAKTGGSTFKNPAGHSAWELVDRAGCRGLRLGGAQVSEKHTNFLINTGGATAAEIEALGEEVRRRVLDLTGITLDWEIKRIGEAAKDV